MELSVREYNFTAKEYFQKGFHRRAPVVSTPPLVSTLEALKSSRMNSKSDSTESGQGCPRGNWRNNAGFALRTGGWQHLPNGAPPSPCGFTARGVGPMGNMAAVVAEDHAYQYNAEEEFKKHVVRMLIQGDADMRVAHLHAEQMHLRMDAVSMELTRTQAELNVERKWREEVMSVLMAKENEDEERVRREKEEAKKRREEQDCIHQEEMKRIHEAIARLEMGQLALKEQVEKTYDEEEQKKRQENDKKMELLTREMLEKDKKEEEEKMLNTPPSEVQTPATRTPSSRGSDGITCFNCHQTGHYARDCLDLDLECDSCGGVGHSTENCIPIKRCYNCNKLGHRQFECREQGSRRCFHCRKVGHLAINCKNTPNE